jgi:hypothetical protein
MLVSARWQQLIFFGEKEFGEVPLVVVIGSKSKGSSSISIAWSAFLVEDSKLV